ncbi:MAG: hypothetical protein MUE88_11645 [Flavobacteriales bacterium]|nr:hypothetical protein [Flavobacteriales bacterium]
MNAAGVLQVPLAMSVWDDGWGISVSKDYQTTKGSISTLLQGFQKEEGTNGVRIYRTKGWDYAGLNRTYEEAIALCREEQVPCLIHVEEVTQPQGHSTSGSHERYKSTVSDWIRDKDGKPVEEVPLLEWYKVYDCNVKFREWILSFRPGGEPIATAEELDAIEKQAKADVRAAQKAAWAAYLAPIQQEAQEVVSLLDALAPQCRNQAEVAALAQDLRSAMDPGRREVLSAARRALTLTLGEESAERSRLQNWVDRCLADNGERYGSHLYSESRHSCLCTCPKYRCATTAMSWWTAASSSATTSPCCSRRTRWY